MSEKKFDPLASLSTRNGGWIILLLIQGVYLSLDAAEISTENMAFGIAASSFMGLLGLIIIFYSVKDFVLRKGDIDRGIFEGIFYVFFAAVILYYKNRRYKQNLKIKNELSVQTERNELINKKLRELRI